MERQRIRLDDGTWFAIDSETISIGKDKISLSVPTREVYVLTAGVASHHTYISFGLTTPFEDTIQSICGNIEITDEQLEKLAPALNEAGVNFHV